MNSDEWILDWEKETNREFLFNLIIDSEFDYESLKKQFSFYSDLNKIYDLTFVIPIRNRNRILIKFIESYKNLIIPKDLKINLVVVESGKFKLNKKTCEINNIDYIFIKDNNIFNKCLCYNYGVFFGPKSDNYLFHDVDVLINKNFIIDLLQNIKIKKTKILQTFNNSLVDLTKQTSNKILNNDIEIDSLNIYNFNNRVGPGGSIHIDRKTFFDVGGFDTGLFRGWGYEDSLFWDKVSTISKIERVDCPVIYLYHLYHRKFWGGDKELTKINQKIYDTWSKYFSQSDKINAINIFKNRISRYE